MPGKTTKDIAKQFCVSPQTVRNVAKRLGVNPQKNEGKSFTFTPEQVQLIAESLAKRLKIKDGAPGSELSEAETGRNESEENEKTESAGTIEAMAEAISTMRETIESLNHQLEAKDRTIERLESQNEKLLDNVSLLNVADKKEALLADASPKLSRWQRLKEAWRG